MNAVKHHTQNMPLEALHAWLRRWQEKQAACGQPVSLDWAQIPDQMLSGIASDSRAVQPGFAFIAVRGQRVDGLDFAAEAVRQGAQVVIAAERNVLPPLPVPVVSVPQLEQHLGPLAASFYHEPSRVMPVVGVTGTNGKSSCVHFLAQAWSLCGRGNAAFIGTLGVGRPDAYRDGTHTTPDALRLQRALHELREQATTLAAVEVSSHALDQGRVAGTDFAVGIFTNLTRDHLDYHNTMAAYGAAKARLFRDCPCAVAVINIDDEFGAQLAAELKQNPVPGQQVLRYSLRDSAAEIRGSVTALDRSGLRMAVTTPWGEGDFHTHVLGRFQAANLLSVIAALGALGCEFSAIAHALALLQAVPGRMQPVGEINSQSEQPLVLVDYAHTPDALEQALLTAREICTGQLWCVFGCGGDRDRGKRPQMGAVAARLADHIVITSDNPRSEPPLDIIRDVAAGVPESAATAVSKVADRGEAIVDAITRARADDVVLIAGKGHEPYQEIDGVRRPFDDAACALQALERAA